MSMFLKIACAVAASASVLCAEDWPQWRGPNRDGISRETGLLKEWPKGGPKLVWKADGVGKGFASVAVAKGRIFTMGDDADACRVRCLDVDGKPVWNAAVGKAGAPGGYVGPRCTPTVDGEVLYALGQAGDLVCLAVADGKELWRKNFGKDYKGRLGGWGGAESPLVDGDLLLCTPGGADAGIVALNKKTGETVWKSAVPNDIVVRVNREKVTKADTFRLVQKDGRIQAELNGKAVEVTEASIGKSNPFDSAAYASLIVANVGGTKQYIQFMSNGVVGVGSDGKFLWRYDHPANGTANISTPIYHDGCVFAASGYGTGGGLVKLTQVSAGNFEADEVYFTREMKNHHGGMILLGDHLYGFNEGILTCLEFKTGKVMWRDRSVGKGSLVLADGRLYARSEGGKGQVALIEANPAKYVETGRFDQPDRSRDSSWPHPVVSNGRLYLRDQDVLLCYDVSGK